MKRTLLILLTFCTFVAPVQLTAVSAQVDQVIECPVCYETCFNPNYAAVPNRNSVITHMPGTDEQDLHIICRDCFNIMVNRRDLRCPICREEMHTDFAKSASQQKGIFDLRRKLKTKADAKAAQGNNRERERQQELDRKRKQEQAERLRQQKEQQYREHVRREQAQQREQQQQRKAKEQTANTNNGTNPPNPPKQPNDVTWNIVLLICALPFMYKWYVNKMNQFFA